MAYFDGSGLQQVIIAESVLGQLKSMMANCEHIQQIPFGTRSFVFCVAECECVFELPRSVNGKRVPVKCQDLQ